MRIEEILENKELVLAVLREGTREAARIHREKGVPWVVSRNGVIMEIDPPPDEFFTQNAEDAWQVGESRPDYGSK